MKAVIVDCKLYNVENSPLEEMDNLLHTLNIDIDSVLSQALESISKAIYIGSGFLNTLGLYVKENNIDLVVFNNDLSPLQIRNINKVCDCEIYDRSMVIIKIFQVRAQSKEAQLQVEIASKKYFATRLIDPDKDYAQITSGGAGGLQNKGSGEKEINLKKYYIRQSIKNKEVELQKLAKRREDIRAKRSKVFPVVAIVGYTNAGKSTLMNDFIRLTENTKKDLILEENRLFATLSTTTRFIKVDNYYPFLLTDTVGFISNLPTTLIQAFKSTLEEIKDADILIHVIDISSENWKKEKEVTEQTLKEIGVINKPVIYLYNKIDKVEKDSFHVLNNNELYTNLKSKEEYKDILQLIDETIHDFYVELELFIPFEESNVYYDILNNYAIIETKENEYGYNVICKISKFDVKKYTKYLVIKKELGLE